MSRRVVFDSNTVLSALLFENGSLEWLRSHWQLGDCLPLACRETVAELTRVLAYPKFHLTVGDSEELLAEYLPHCMVVELTKRCAVRCRDHQDQPFLDLAQSGKARVLVSGDKDLLALAGRTSFAIETPENYRRSLGKLGLHS